MKNVLLIAILSLSNFSSLLSQSFFDQLYLDNNEDKQEIHIVMDIAYLMDHVEDEEYQNATIKWVRGPGDTLSMGVNAKARGKSRKKICSFPPVKLKFKKDTLEAHGFDRDFNDHKLVLQCRDVRGYDQYLYKEYMIYKFYSLFSPIAFRVQLVDVWFIDPNHPKQRTRRKGFIIEDENQLAARNEGEIRDRKVTSLSKFDDNAYFRFCLFQFFIANTDWAMGNLHNLKFLTHTESGTIYPVPYDFDYSGMVNTPYSVPMKGLPIESVTARYYRGANPVESVFWAELDHFAQHMPTMQAMCDDFTYLEKRHNKSIGRMIRSFQRMLDKPRRLYRIVQVKEEENVKQ